MNPNFIDFTPNQAALVVSNFIYATISALNVYFGAFTTYHLFCAVRNVSQNTQRMQRRFFLALLLQSFTPGIGIVIPMYYYLFAYTYNYYNQKYNNFAMIAIGFNGLLATFAMILVHQPYREAVKKMMSGAAATGRKLSKTARTSVFSRPIALV
ncbi:unnamed protein product [Caenorhabditis sp. 36 PRJEB53466]|nr:unnamed protein product [Caenorhabditis sp. 36 PRJEB53466]